MFIIRNILSFASYYLMLNNTGVVFCHPLTIEKKGNDEKTIKFVLKDREVIGKFVFTFDCASNEIDGFKSC